MFGLITRAEHDRILAEGHARAAEVIAETEAERDAEKLRGDRLWSTNKSLGALCRELMDERDAANAILDTAYVRGPKGRMQRYRAETGA